MTPLVASTPDADRQWMRAHQVRWELTPLVEMVKGQGLRQTTWRIAGYGRFDPTGMERPAEEAASIHAGLRDLLTRAAAGRRVGFLGAARAVVPPDAPRCLDVEVAAVADSADALKEALAVLAAGRER